MKVLVTGGLGYIGSHTCVALLEKGNDVVVIDNLYNAKREVKERIERIAGRQITFYEMDLLEEEKLISIFEKERVDSVIHFAGYKAVGESVSKPLKYYQNNLQSTVTLLRVMEQFDCNTIVFSSSATVYAPDNHSPLVESMPLRAINPYGQTKLMIEQILQDVCVANPKLCAVILRYFNPIGAHESGLLGESPVGIPNNLMPYICQVADGRREKLQVFGDDYDTVDGTGVRDYIHVVDLAMGHVAALEHAGDKQGTQIFNLGTGKGTSVLELVHTFEEVNDLEIPYEIVGRRPGDNATVFASTQKAENELGWRAKHTIAQCCESAWNYQKTMEMN